VPLARLARTPLHRRLSFFRTVQSRPPAAGSRVQVPILRQSSITVPSSTTDFSRGLWSVGRPV